MESQISENIEFLMEAQLRSRVIDFVFNYDPDSEEDRFHAAEVIFGVPEKTISRWCLEELYKHIADNQDTDGVFPGGPGKSSGSSGDGFFKLQNIIRLLSDIKNA